MRKRTTALAGLAAAVVATVGAEVKTTDGTRVWELQLDPTSGAVVGNQPEE